MAREDPAPAGYEGAERLLDLHRVGRLREPEPARDAADVSVHDDAARDAVGAAEDDVGGLPRHARQPGDLLHRLRHLAVELLRDHLARRLDGLRLVAEVAGGADDLLDVLRLGRGQGSWRRIALEELRSDPVDRDVGALGREDRRDEELPGRLEVELDPRHRHDPLEALPDGVHALLQRLGRGAYLPLGLVGSTHGSSAVGMLHETNAP